MKLFVVMVWSLTITSVFGWNTKWNINNTQVEMRGFELFSERLIGIFDILLNEMRDVVITDGGRRLSNLFTDVISKHGNNVIMFCSYSYIINNLKLFEGLLTRHEFSLLILSDWDDSNLMDFLDVLRYKHMYIVIAFYNNVSKTYLQATMEKCLQRGLLHTVVIVNNYTSVNIIRGKFSTSPSCKTEIIIKELTWKPKKLHRVSYIFNAKQKIDMNGCVLNISTISIPPNVIVDRKNGIKPISGFETQMIREMGRDMNFTPNFHVHKFLVWGGSYDNGTSYGILGEVITGVSEIAYGVIWPTWNRKVMFDLSLPYENDCFGWAVPRGAAFHSLRYTLTGFLTDGFRYRSWICIFVSAMCICLLYVLHSVLLVSCDRFSIFEASCVGFLVTVSSLVQKSVHKSYLLPHLSMKIIFIIWLFYTFLIATMYNGILAERFVFPDVHPDLNTIEDLLETNLPMVTSHDVYRTIIDIDSNETLYNLVKQRIQVRSPSRDSIPKIMSGQKLAYCRNLETLYYYRDEKITSEMDVRNNFHIMKDCFLTYPLVIALRLVVFGNRL